MAKRTIHVKTIIKMDDTPLSKIAGGKDEIAYSDFLKALWKHWKKNGLYRMEKINVPKV
jgi:hypothetical protein